MIRILYIQFVLTLFFTIESTAQFQKFNVKVVPFNSRITDEFSPVFFKNGIVFCSDRAVNSITSYNDRGNNIYKIFFVERKDSTKWETPKLFSKELTTDFNDGPVTFNEKGDIVYYTRNNEINRILKNVSDTSNKLGIYSAEYINGIWSNIHAFPYNDPDYTFCTPALAPDGSRIYFSSDKPGGFGGMDLYYCDKQKDEWSEPVNLGKLVNSQKNETFPFVSRSGKLYFSSDGHEGFGGKDIFYTQEVNNQWIFPVHLDSAINSPADDFGIVVDSLSENGFFSSNRRKSDDIYSFKSAPIIFYTCDTIKENRFCFTFYDERYQFNDTIPIVYEWDFGNGIKRFGNEVNHCFPGPGKYSVKLSIIDQLTGKALIRPIDYPVELENIQQIYINSCDVGVVDIPITFDGLKTELDSSQITDYYWNFGDGFTRGAPVISKTFKKKGKYSVQLGLLLMENNNSFISKKCAAKEVRIYDSFEDWELKDDNSVLIENQNDILYTRFCFMDDLSEKQKNKIKELFKESRKYALQFNKYGIVPESFDFLDNIVVLLKMNTDIRLEMAVNTLQDNKGIYVDWWARELAFYLKNKNVNLKAYSSKGFGMSHPTFKPIVSANTHAVGTLELIFYKNQ